MFRISFQEIYFSLEALQAHEQWNEAKRITSAKQSRHHLEAGCDGWRGDGAISTSI